MVLLAAGPGGIITGWYALQTTRMTIQAGQSRELREGRAEAIHRLQDSVINLLEVIEDELSEERLGAPEHFISPKATYLAIRKTDAVASRVESSDVRFAWQELRKSILGSTNQAKLAYLLVAEGNETMKKNLRTHLPDVTPERLATKTILEREDMLRLYENFNHVVNRALHIAAGESKSQIAAGSKSMLHRDSSLPSL